MLLLKFTREVDKGGRSEGGLVPNPRAISTKNQLLARQQARAKHSVPRNPLPWGSNILQHIQGRPAEVIGHLDRHGLPHRGARTKKIHLLYKTKSQTPLACILLERRKSSAAHNVAFHDALQPLQFLLKGIAEVMMFSDVPWRHPLPASRPAPHSPHRVSSHHLSNDMTMTKVAEIRRS